MPTKPEVGANGRSSRKSAARIGIDSAVPDRVLKMPPCDVRDPGALPYLKLAPSTQFVSVELTYRDGSVSEIKSFRR